MTPGNSPVTATPASRGRFKFGQEFADAGTKVMCLAHARLRQDCDDIASRLGAAGHPLGGESHARELLAAVESRMSLAFAEVDDRARSILQGLERIPTDEELAYSMRQGCAFIGVLLSGEVKEQLARCNGTPAADVPRLMRRLEELMTDHIAASRLRAQAVAGSERDARDASRDRWHTRGVAWAALLIAFASVVFSALPYFGVTP